MAEALGARAAWALRRAIAGVSQARETEASGTARFVRTDSDGQSWVILPGSEAETPVNGTMLAAAKAGQLVRYTLRDGRLSVTGNATEPAVGLTVVRSEVAPAIELAGGAKAAADRAELDAGRAKEAADRAEYDAGRAHDAADDAKASATRANTSALDALAQLSCVEDVLGTVTWIAEHGRYSPTADVAVDPDKTYYVRVPATDAMLVDALGALLATSDGSTLVSCVAAASDGWLYLPVGEPRDEDIATYYELTVDEALSRYVASHLALTDAGLWVLKDDSGFRVLLANDGMSIIDAAGHVVATFGESITLDSARPVYIGGEDAYIVYYDADGDGHPDSILIGGDNVSLGAGGRTLSQVLADVEQASEDAAAARDSATLSITSTNGQLFKNGAESTVLQLAVFPNGGGRLDTIEEVRERFGAAAYIEWRWKHEDSGAWGTVVSDDEHLSHGGMWLTVTPEDVATKTTFEASLVTP